jgi:hypothetical protein
MMVMALLGLAATSAASQGHAQGTFSFKSVEFLPREQRLPAVQAFVDQNVVVGQPIAPALEAIRKAGAYCPAPKAPHRTFVCTHSSFQRHPGAGLDDVTWRVRVRPADDNTIAVVAVSRTKSGG